MSLYANYLGRSYMVNIRVVPFSTYVSCSALEYTILEYSIKTMAQSPRSGKLCRSVHFSERLISRITYFSYEDDTSEILERP